MSINSFKKLYGLVGYPVKHSFSPAMHNAAFKHCNINAEYRLFEVKPDSLEDFLINLDKKAIYGLNITIPYKVGILNLVKGRTVVDNDMSVLLTGAINTIKKDNNKLLYKNTDVTGFKKSLIQDLKFQAQQREVFIIGCGGAARAVIAALLEKSLGIKKIYIYDNNKEALILAKIHFSRLEEIIESRLEFIEDKEEIFKIISDCQLLVNTSPLGMKDGDSSPINKDLLREDLFVYDVVYNRETQLVKDAKEKCKAAVGGLGMLLYQGAAAWEFWTGKKAPVDIMRQALEKAMEDKC